MSNATDGYLQERPDHKQASASMPPAAHALARSYLPFAALWLLSIPLFWGPLRELVALSLGDRRYSHLIVIPLISAFFLYLERHRILAGVRFSLWPGTALIGGALALYAPFAFGVLHPGDDYRLSVLVLTICLVWAAAFALCYGASAARAARFPLLLLLLLVPVPSPWMDRVIAVLQRGAAESVYLLFQLARVPVVRNGVEFDLPGIAIEVAPECSAIHSAWALFITGVLVAHLFLKSNWGKFCLAVLTVPIAMFTNAVRIFTLWSLAVKFDPAFLTGDMHQRGGILFSVVSVSILLCSLFTLRRLEARLDRTLWSPGSAR